MVLTEKLNLNAIRVLESSAVQGYLQASSNQKDNYTNLWARDSAVSILAIVVNKLEHLYPVSRKSLELLLKAANDKGQIPSNVRPGIGNSFENISFGGVAGRTDASFWWLIAAISLLNEQPDEVFEEMVRTQAEKIFSLADAWEFNGKHLMYLPMSSNWADEYITHGYVLYDQLLRYWALQLAADKFGNNRWDTKSRHIKAAIKQHYLFEQSLTGSLYTQALQYKLGGFDLEQHFIASFCPGDFVARFDGWSAALLLLLDIPSPDSKRKLCRQMQDIFLITGSKGVPAFWPVIKKNDSAYQSLLNNHSFSFKNESGHFHNGGIWPVVNGFVVTALNASGNQKMASVLLKSMTLNLHNTEPTQPFAEYFDLYEGQAGGMTDLCFSAAGYLLAQRSVSPEAMACILPDTVKRAAKLGERYQVSAAHILTLLPQLTNKVFVIAVAGQSGSGKTTLSIALKDELEQRGLKTLLLHQDDYFLLPPRQNHLARLNDFTHIGYSEVRLDKLDADIKIIKDQQEYTVRIPHMNWVTDTEEYQTLDIDGVRILIVEGTYTSLLKETDFRIFFDSDYLETRENRLNRARDEASDFIERVLQKESSLISVHRPLADLVLNRNLEVTYFRNVS